MPRGKLNKKKNGDDLYVKKKNVNISLMEILNYLKWLAKHKLEHFLSVLLQNPRKIFSSSMEKGDPA